MNYLSPQWTLFIGIVLALTLPQSQQREEFAKKYSSIILKLSVILLGASLNFNHVLKQGSSGLIITFLSILFVFGFGHIFIKLIQLEKTQATLITMGTAICGGSAIGALAPILKADSIAIAVSMGVVFVLNALAVFIFPPIGEFLNFSQEQFGTWSAIAIHDTSSVVAASAIYGNKALEIATTIKLTRALWIIPITLCYSIFLRKDQKTKISIPWFIGGFLILSLIFTFFSLPKSIQGYFAGTSKLGFSITLFLIGLTFSTQKIKAIGTKPFIFGMTLWLFVSVVSLTLIKYTSFVN